MEIATEQHTTHTTRRWYQEVKPHPEYLRTIPGILKMVEIGLCVLILICSHSHPWGYIGGGWVSFASATSLINVFFNFVIHFVDIQRFFFFWYFLEFVEYCIWDVLLTISAIIAASQAFHGPAIVATTVFNFAAVCVFGVDTYFMYRAWQNNKAELVGLHHETTVTSVTTVTPVSTKY